MSSRQCSSFSLAALHLHFQDVLDGSRVCTVCRDLVLVCTQCQSSLREYHCSRHSRWKECYFSFLEVFDRAELVAQQLQLQEIRESLNALPSTKNTRRALTRQIDKVRTRLFVRHLSLPFPLRGDTLSHFACLCAQSIGGRTNIRFRQWQSYSG